MRLIRLAATMLMLLPSVALSSTETVDDGAFFDTDEVCRSPWHGPSWNGPKDVLWDNGPIVTSIGTGVGGADESIIDPAESTNGFGCQWGADIRLADDFEVPAGATWQISSITLFGYQTNEGPPSTIIACYIEIYDNPPEYGSSVYGDLFTNVMTSSEWTNCYRVNQAGSGNNTARPVMASVCEFSTPITLTEGTYWLCFQQDGLGESGPWTPPITIDGQLETGDAVQYYTGAWDYIADVTSGMQKGLPFIIEGSSTGALENGTWAGIKASF